MNSFELEKVSAVLGPKWGLSNLTLELKSGELALVIGPNGSGKSTALRVMAGLYHINQGSIKLDVDGKSVDSPDWRDQVAFLPETFYFPSKQKVQESLRFFLQLRGLSAKQSDALISSYAEQWKLSQYLNNQTNECSVGIIQLLKVALVLMAPRALTILDEPLESLDPRAQQSVWKQIRAVLDAGSMVVVSLFSGFSELVKPAQIMRMKSGRAYTSKDYVKAMKDYEEDLAHS